MSHPRLITTLVLASLTAVLNSCAKVKPWERGDLARAVMAPDRDALGHALDEHLYFSREATHGGGGVGGGGCGCN